MVTSIRIALLSLFCIAVCSSATVAGDVGHVIVVRPSGDALVIWDATSQVIDIVHDKVADKDANDRLERDGLKALSSKMSSLNKSSRQLTLRVVYKKTAAVNSEYGTPTLEGVEKYATIDLDAKDAFGDRDGWTKLSPHASLPSWIKFNVIGQLPPR